MRPECANACSGPSEYGCMSRGVAVCKHGQDERNCVCISVPRWTNTYSHDGTISMIKTCQLIRTPQHIDTWVGLRSPLGTMAVWPRYIAHKNVNELMLILLKEYHDVPIFARVRGHGWMNMYCSGTKRVNLCKPLYTWMDKYVTIRWN